MTTADSSDSVHALLLDDNEGEGNSLAQLLESDELAVKVLTPSPGLEDTRECIEKSLPADGVAVVLLDYRLDDRQDVDFRGATVASAVKEHHPEIPMVLLTTDRKLREWVETRPGMEDLFDWWMLKGEVTAAETRDNARMRIIDIGRGWARFAAAASTEADPWEILASEMNVPRETLDVFERVEGNPPLADVAGSLALWLLHGPLRWEGPLRASDDTRVALGVTPESFLEEAVSDWLGFARYEGPFARFRARWWGEPIRRRLFEVAGTATLDATCRAQVLSREISVDLEMEGCSWCGGPRTIKACALCLRAVDAAHSLRELTDPAPDWAESPVVCFRCVADGTAENVRLVPGEDDVVDGLRTGSITPPTE